MSFLAIADSSPNEISELVRLGAEIKREPDRFRTRLGGRSVGLFFMKPSLRTWVSCDVGTAELGGHPLLLRQDQTGFGSREKPEDVGRVLDRYVDALGMRVFDHDDLERLAAVMDAPVVNLLSDREHPCQAVADVMTIAEHRPLPGAAVAFVGDGNNVCHSLMLACAMSGASVRVASPPGFAPDASVVEFARSHADVLITEDPAEAVAGADAVYTDVWTSMGQEAEKAERLERFSAYQVNPDLFSRADPDAIFMHCLPAHRGEEVTDEVADHPRSRIFDQAENRLHSFKAVLVHEMG